MSTKLYYNYTNDEGRESLVVNGDGISEVIPGSHPMFREIFRYLQRNPDPDTYYLSRLLDLGRALVADVNNERVQFDGTNLTFDSEVVDTSLSRHIVRMMQAGDTDYTRWVKFLENISRNPSTESREHLFSWLQERDFSITPEGHFVGYKAVNSDDKNSSIHSGTADVNGVTHNGHIPNPVGAVISMPRDKVATSRQVGCSTGLHVGTHAFARSFGGGGSRQLRVSVDPADVVSVPEDSQYQKLRTCKYRVLEVYTGDPTIGTSYDPDEEEYWEDED